MMHSTTVWLTGELRDADFAAAIAWLRDAMTCVDVSADSFPESTAEFPAAIVLFQAKPGAISQRRVESLHRRAPLARLIVVAGPWCEGELRSGRPPHGITRILWHQWQTRLPSELGVASGETARPVYLPRTLTPVDLLLRTPRKLPNVDRTRGIAAVCSASRSTFDTLADACTVAGLEPRWQQPGDWSQVEGADLVLLDGREGLTSWRDKCLPSRPALWLVDWPRPDDLALAEQHGIRRVLARPFLLADFVTAVDTILPRPALDKQAISAA
jgi:hypothetical protein